MKCIKIKIQSQNSLVKKKRRFVLVLSAIGSCTVKYFA